MSNLISKSLVPGFYRACTSLDSLLLSTLECFFENQNCLANIIQFYDQLSFATNITRLNSSVSSRFATNSLINDIFLELFIEY